MSNTALPAQAVLLKRVTEQLKSVFQSQEHYRRLLCHTGEEAQKILDTWQMLLDTRKFDDRRNLVMAVKRLSAKSQKCPTRFRLRVPEPRLREDPITAGTFADIYAVDFYGESTCFKMLRASDKTLVVHMEKVYAAEACVWGQLSHINILPFYGISLFHSRICFVSPRAVGGTVTSYLTNNPGASRTLLCLDAAHGLRYLHTNDIVHGDVKAGNIVVDRSGRASLCDFGFSCIDDPHILAWASQSSAKSSGGSARWQAPELHEPNDDENKKVLNSKESDVFALACTFYEIFTGHHPYFETTRPSSIILKIMRGGTPTRPADADPAWLQHGLNERIWKLMKDCWSSGPLTRPDMTTVISRLDTEKPNDTRPPGEWEERNASRFRNMQDSNGRKNLLVYLDYLDGILRNILKNA